MKVRYCGSDGEWKPLQSGVRFDYIGLSGSYQLQRPIQGKENQSIRLRSFSYPNVIVSSKLLSVVGVCKALTVKKMTRLMVRTLISLVHSLLIAGVVSVRLDQQTESMGFQGASDRKIKD
jgi:hypothetical protein